MDQDAVGQSNAGGCEEGAVLEEGRGSGQSSNSGRRSGQL